MGKNRTEVLPLTSLTPKPAHETTVIERLVHDNSDSIDRWPPGVPDRSDSQ